MEQRTYDKLKLLGHVLYAVAIILLLANIYFLLTDNPKKALEFSAYTSLIITACYQLWFQKQKSEKKTS